MKIIIAPDSFKGTFSALEAAELIKQGLSRVIKDADYEIIPVADGGEGTLDCVIHSTGGKIIKLPVMDPLGRKRNARIGFFNDGSDKAVLEMADASGLMLLTETERNPLFTTTYGSGELIRKALEINTKQIIVGAGGSATIDGGCGAAQALGVRFIDKYGNFIAKPFIGKYLKQIANIDLSDVEKISKQSEIIVACDVRNQVLGPDGAAITYGPQKGADSNIIEELEEGLTNLAKVVEKDLGVKIDTLERGGAAGALGAGLYAFLGAKLEDGFEVVSNLIKLTPKIQYATLVVTGEGCFDLQTLNGKAPFGVIQKASVMNVPVIVIPGKCLLDKQMENQLPIIACFPAENKPESSSPRITNLINAAEKAGQWIKTKFY